MNIEVNDEEVEDYELSKENERIRYKINANTYCKHFSTQV